MHRLVLSSLLFWKNRPGFNVGSRGVPWYLVYYSVPGTLRLVLLSSFLLGKNRLWFKTGSRGPVVSRGISWYLVYYFVYIAFGVSLFVPEKSTWIEYRSRKSHGSYLVFTPYPGILFGVGILCSAKNDLDLIKVQGTPVAIISCITPYYPGMMSFGVVVILFVPKNPPGFEIHRGPVETHLVSPTVACCQ